MQPAAFPHDEKSRIAVLHSLHLLDTPPEERFDRLTRIAKRMFAVPIAQVSLVDATREWIKASAGLPARESPRAISFCAHAILGDGVFCVPDARADARFFDNPLVVGEPKIRFYAGCPLRVANQKLGTLCLIDNKPRELSSEEKQLLMDLARMAEDELVEGHLAATDELTGLANRRGFEAFARHVLAVCKRLDKPATLVYFDLDRFKGVNDRFGHAEGDRALKIFADELGKAFRESDAAARVGGDEFVALLTNALRGDAVQAIERMRAGLAKTMEQERYAIGFSAGIAELDREKHASLDDLLRDADAAMYEEKRAGAGSARSVPQSPILGPGKPRGLVPPQSS